MWPTSAESLLLFKLRAPCGCRYRLVQVEPCERLPLDREALVPDAAACHQQEPYLPVHRWCDACRGSVEVSPNRAQRCFAHRGVDDRLVLPGILARLDTPDVERVDGRWPCPTCGKLARDHPDDPEFPYPTFVLLCDGRHAKV